MFEGKFGVGDGAFQVSGLQPDLVSFNEGCESLVVTQGHNLVSEFMGSKSFILSSDKRL